jgi:hypothetical protein
MAEEFLGKQVELSFIEKKPRVKTGRILEINDLGVVFQVENYRNQGEAKSFLVLNDDITSISESTGKRATAKSTFAKKATAKKETKPEAAKPPVEPEPEPPSTETVDSSDLVDNSEFDDIDDLDFDND